MKGFKFLFALFIAITAAFLYGCSASDCNNTGTGTSPIAPIAPSAIKGVITGTVRDTDGNPIAGASITATATQVKASTVTAADGTYSISDLDLGTYSVTAVYNGTTLTQQEVNLSSTTPQAIADFTFPAEPVSGTISGTIKDFDGTVPDSATIELSDMEGNIIRTITTTDGKFRFEDLELGNYVVTAQPLAYTDSPSKPVTISKDNLNHIIELQYTLLAGG